MPAELYFAYGSNMSAAAMAQIGLEMPAKGVARLPGHRLAFMRQSVKWGAGAADVVKRTGCSVYGVLYEVGPADLARLDKKEGAPRAYGRTQVTVYLGDERLQAITYTVAAAAHPAAGNLAKENLADEIRADVIPASSSGSLPSRGARSPARR